MSTLPHPCGLPSSCSCCALMIYLQHCHHISTLTHPYALAPPPHPHDFAPMLPPHIHPHPSIQFCTPVAYRPHAPAAPS
ncbi:hypothetical protein O181_031250 [Austropuccinia psidii MF-1]|uniref:Uncharacterized protein n=1 Tax=Austropuccinia psidii MF-1 TaxID=1389203 RepID=A0A9Q3CXM0_9BASI|nr:hypothetical protein [Austropuccinia psidii MF-1]